MSRVHFGFIPALCSGCGACVAACMDAHSDFSMPPRRIVRSTEEVLGDDVRITWYSLACLHCEQHPCVAVCPRGCFSANEDTGLVTLDNTACIGCRRCARACPNEGIRFTADRRARKCDGCAERLAAGLLPRCAAACPQGAITIS